MQRRKCEQMILTDRFLLKLCKLFMFVRNLLSIKGILLRFKSTTVFWSQNFSAPCKESNLERIWVVPSDITYLSFNSPKFVEAGPFAVLIKKHDMFATNIETMSCEHINDQMLRLRMSTKPSSDAAHDIAHFILCGIFIEDV